MVKRLLVASLLFVPVASFGWEHPKNPDRFPSLGLTYTGIAEEGEYETQGFKQDIETATGKLILDTRLPLSNSFTLSLALGAVASTYEGKDDAVFFGDKSETSGGLFSISGRYYFNK